MFPKPRVSVLITVFNSEKHIRKTLLNLSKQTMRDLEIICVDDGSTDSSAQIIEALQLADCRIKLIKQKNTGLGGALKSAVNHASADYVFPLDHDDSISDDALEKAYEVAIATNSEVVLFELYSDSPDGKQEKLIDLDNFNWPMDGSHAMQLTLSSWKLHGAGLYKKNLYSKCYNHYRVDLYNANEFLTRVLLYKASKVMRACGKYYYFNESSSMSQRFNIKHLEFLDTQYELLRFLRDENVSKEIYIDWAVGTLKWIRILNKKVTLNKALLTQSEFNVAVGKIKKALKDMPKKFLVEIFLSSQCKAKYRLQSIMILLGLEYYLYKLTCRK